jgi:hypothetical protein
MISRKQGLRVCALGAVLLSAVGTAAAQNPGDNTTYGSGALQNNTTGQDNNAFGFDALFSNTEGSTNTAIGVFALYSNTGAGSENTAIGDSALYSNTTADDNTAIGGDALFGNTTGTENTADGRFALYSNTTGNENTADGSQSLYSNTTGNYNTASGFNALLFNSTGVNDTADGVAALQGNTTGYGNEASGVQALYKNTSGFHNTAVGDSALHNNTTGHSNIGIGFNGGFNLTGSNNIEVGSLGTGSDANTIRLGTQGTQTATYIAGISGTAMTGADVVVSSSGRLGVLPSSARYKKDIQSLSNRSQGLWQLRPVTFRYKQDPQGERQYGLIAEEVAKVYPELVVRGDKGEIESVQYRELIPLMLNEMQRQQAALTELKMQNVALQAHLERLEQAKKPLASR